MKDIILTILVNLFIADNFYLIVFYMIASIYSILLSGEQSIIPFFIIIPFLILLVLLKYFSLPVFYNLMEKKSKNDKIQKFIKNLKENSKLRIGILLFPIIFAIMLFNRCDENNPQFCFWASIIYYFFISWFSSYLVLFLYWDIKKKKLEKKECN